MLDQGRAGCCRSFGWPAPVRDYHGHAVGGQPVCHHGAGDARANDQKSVLMSVLRRRCGTRGAARDCQIERPVLRSLDFVTTAELSCARVPQRFLRGTFLPFLRAFERPMAIACLRLFTLPPLPPRPLFAVPFLYRRISRSTSVPFPALFEYFRFLAMLGLNPEHEPASRCLSMLRKIRRQR